MNEKKVLIAEKVLIADDDVAYRLALGGGIEYDGYAADYASSADEAIAMATSGTYYAIITDNNMKDGYVDSGLHAIAEVRKSNKRTPIIFTTADMTEEKERAARSLGATDVMKKPVNLGDLITILERYTVR